MPSVNMPVQRLKVAILPLDYYYYLLCAKMNFPTRWLNKGNKNATLKQEEIFKVRLLNESIRWL